MQFSDLAETVTSTRRIYTGGIINVERWDVTLPNGHAASRDIVLHNGAAAVIPVDEHMRVAVVTQFRVAVGALTREIPAGKLDSPGEDPLACAQRELREETGLTARDWTPLGAIYTSVGFCNERIHLFLARGLSGGAAQPDADEFLRVEWCPLSALAGDALSGRIEDAKTRCAVLQAAMLLKVGADA